jgi:hypothetical protein
MSGGGSFRGERPFPVEWCILRPNAWNHTVNLASVAGFDNSSGQSVTGTYDVSVYTSVRARLDSRPGDPGSNLSSAIWANS